MVIWIGIFSFKDSDVRVYSATTQGCMCNKFSFEIGWGQLMQIYIYGSKLFHKYTFISYDLQMFFHVEKNQRFGYLEQETFINVVKHDDCVENNMI